MTEQAGKYARLELERRFLVTHVPAAITEGRRWLIRDRYIKNTRLRLRRIQPIGGGKTIFKLGQKDVPVPSDFSRVTITNIYLSPNEYAVLSELEAHELHKVRHAVEYDGRIFSVDLFNFHLTGLVLAEVSFESAEKMDEKIDLPPWIGAEVSNDIRFTGGALASLTADQAAKLTRDIVSAA